jgi:hypothetical protein
MPAIAIAAAGLAISAVGTVATISSQNKMQKAQANQYKFERQIQTNRSTRERRDAIRAARLTQGALVQTGENQGASGTSSALGGMGSITSQLNSNLSFLDTNTKLADRAGTAAGDARKAAAAASNWNGVTQLGMQIFNNSGTIASKISKPKAP